MNEYYNLQNLRSTIELMGPAFNSRYCCYYFVVFSLFCFKKNNLVKIIAIMFRFRYLEKKKKCITADTILHS